MGAWGELERVKFLEEKVEHLPNEKDQQTASIWVSSIPELIQNKFSYLDAYLPESRSKIVAYKRPPRLRDKLFKPRTIDQENKGTEEFYSKPCGKCLTCGNRKSDGVDCRSMVSFANEIELNTGKKVKLKFNLDCKEAGIYGAKCTTCNEWYVGQTATPFSTRFNGHRGVWKRGVIEDYQNDEKHQSLFDHYKQHHSEFFNLHENEPCKGFDKAYDVYFLDSNLGSRGLTEKEDKWKVKLKASINKNNIITPILK